VSDAGDLDPSNPGSQAARDLGLTHSQIRFGDQSVDDAAKAAGLAHHMAVKSLLVRRGEGDYLLVLVAGDRSISWPKLRSVLGVSRLSMPDADTAFEVTGYRRGTITPLGLSLPVIVDEGLVGRPIRVGSGEPGVAIGLHADELISALGADVADVTG